MKAKYFTSENREAAEIMASNYFELDKENITFEVINEETDHCELLAVIGQPGEVANMDAHYGLYYESDGVYLELYKNRGFGNALERDDLIHHLDRKNIKDYRSAPVQALIEKAAGRTKIAGAQKEYIYGEDINVVIAADDLQASARLLAPEPGGTSLDIETAKQKLNDAGVKHGIDEQALQTLLNDKNYGVLIVVAAATPPKNGEDGKLVFNFSIDERTGRPREIGRGRVDYRSLDLYVPVVEGQLLVTRTWASEGHPGVSVRGLDIKHRPGKEIALPRGKNVDINDEKTEMHARCSGMVEFVNNSVNVSSVYKINGDCDLSVGNIDFDGSVHISGNVRLGNTIKATGGVFVGGSVEAATIIAGGNVEVKGGMQGAGKGLIRAGGSVKMVFVERGTVHAGGSITIDVCMHSYLESGDTLIATGRRGAIIGGHVGASHGIVANYIGALSNARTEVTVGVMPSKRARLQHLQKELQRLGSEQTKLEMLEAYLEKSKATMNPETWEKLYRSGVEHRNMNTKEIVEYSKELDDLNYDLEHATDGRIHVLETVFSGSRVLIGSDIYVATDEISYVSFRYSEGQVVFGACELSKSA